MHFKKTGSIDQRHQRGGRLAVRGRARACVSVNLDLAYTVLYARVIVGEGLVGCRILAGTCRRTLLRGCWSGEGIYVYLATLDQR